MKPSEYISKRMDELALKAKEENEAMSKIGGMAGMIEDRFYYFNQAIVDCLDEIAKSL